MKNQETVTANTVFPIVGIGASAGGLQALEQFLSQVPPDGGMADVVAPALDDAQSQADQKSLDAGFLDKVIVLLRSQTGHDFSLYKKSTITRRIERRMGLHQLSRIEDYLRYLRENPKESELLFNELLIGVTSFFRDTAVWDQLKSEVIPALLDNYPNGVVLRAWSPGCSTGEEAYSLAMIFKETLEERHIAKRFSLQIFASDLDKDAVAIGRAGIYARSTVADVSDKRLSRFFVEDAGGYRVCNEIREMVIFADQNIITDPPFTKLDLLSCRNLLIYLESELQTKLIQLFHYSLNPGGVLVLGSAESIGSAVHLFSPLNVKAKIFRRLDAVARKLPAGFPAAFVHAQPNFSALVDKLVLTRFGPAAVLLTDQGELLYSTGKIGKYLEPVSGKPSHNLFAMAREGLNQALHEPFYRAVRSKTEVALKKIKIGVNGMTQYVDVLVQPLAEPAELYGMVLVVFSDVPLEALMQELTTSKEEMQSMNEELQTVNHELQAKVIELSRASNDMKNLLDSTEIATLLGSTPSTPGGA